MLSAGFGGQTLLSESARALVHRELPEGAWLHDHGPQRLRDLESAEHLFELRHKDIPSDIQGLRTMSERPNNLPEQVTSFVGREEVIEQIKSALGRSRLVTLTGSGGSGKTRAALEAAEDLLDSYPEGVWFVDLGPVIDESLVVKAIASALNVREQAGSTQPIMVGVAGADGGPARLEPYLGTFGHLVVMRQGDLAYVHVHPEAQLVDGQVKFWVAMPSAGTYRMFFDFSMGGKVSTAEFTLKVA
jgi:hypothetical protein